jgi:cupin 2 domain-containing protein
MRARNLLAEAPGDAATEVFTTLLERPGVRIERIVSTGQSTRPGEWYDQAGDEWVLLLEGSAGLSFEGFPEPAVLGPGDYLLILAHQRHRVEWTEAGARTVWLTVHLDV